MQIANCKLVDDGKRLTTHNSLLTNHHDPSYFDFGRDEVVALISQDARTVLDAGCAAGRTGELLKQRQPCEVVGIEIDPMAAQMARTRLDRVIVGARTRHPPISTEV